MMTTHARIDKSATDSKRLAAKYFQAIQQTETTFVQCFDWKGNGDTDIMKTCSVAEKFGLYAEQKRPVFNCIEHHFKRVEHNHEFHALFAQDITYLLQSNADLIEIDLAEVRKIVTAFLPIHEPFYLEFVSELEVIFEPYLHHKPYHA